LPDVPPSPASGEIEEVPWDPESGLILAPRKLSPVTAFV
jgi:hypothetical protein